MVQIKSGSNFSNQLLIRVICVIRGWVNVPQPRFVAFGGQIYRSPSALAG